MSKGYSSTWNTRKHEYSALLLPSPKISIDVDYLIAVHSIQSKSHKDEDMMAFIDNECASMDNVVVERDKYGNIYVTKGDAAVYPCMVSHTDTVHDIQEKFKVFRDDDVIFAFNSVKGKQAGVGGDDKVGVFMTLTMLRMFDNFKAAFFRNEEVGCLGSNQADMTFFSDVSMVLQCDRKGSSDWVDSISSTVLQSDEFKVAVKPILDAHFYKPTNGGMTDVQSLKRNHLPVVCANMSCGYYSPHSDDEVVHIPSVENTLNMCFQIFTQLGHRRWEHTYTPYVYKNSYSGSSSTTPAKTNNGTASVGSHFSRKTYADFNLEPDDLEGINALPYYDRQALAMNDGYYKGGWENKSNAIGWKKFADMRSKEEKKASKKPEQKVEIRAVEVQEVKVEDAHGWRTVNNRFRRYDDENEPLRYYSHNKSWLRMDGSQPYWKPQKAAVTPSEDEMQAPSDADYTIVGTIVCPDCGETADKSQVVGMLQYYCHGCADYQYIASHNLKYKNQLAYNPQDYETNWSGI